MHSLSVLEVRRETPDTVSILLDIPQSLKDQFQFISGQYLTIEAKINGESIRRSYSLCSALYENEWRVAVKKVLNGKFSTYANEILRAGDVVSVMQPMGNFKLSTDADNDNHYVAFAAGSGITPVLSMIKSVMHEEPKSRFTLFYGNRNIDGIIFREEIEALKNKHLDRFSVHHVLSGEKLGSPLFLGRLDADKCNGYAKTLFNPKRVAGYFLCGPSQMIFDIKDALIELGVEETKIHFELFSTDDIPASQSQTPVKKPFDPEKESHVTVIMDGESFDFNLPYGGDSILDAAMKEGADTPFACKGGVCCTCKAHLDEGKVDMDVNYTLEPDEMDAGFILTCQSHPRTARTIVNFDET